jgi:eukaryotic-like serine/threonine-protein kinase
MTDPNIGCILSKRYQLTNLLGQGSMGRVYGAKDLLLGGVPVAIKFLSQTLLNQKMKDRFEREARTCAILGQKSPHIVRVSDCGVNDDGIPFYVMERLEGESLNEVISRQPLSLSRFLNLSSQICEGLECAHQGIEIDGEICPIVHRDIKPSNISINKIGSSKELAKVLDFGIAKLLQEDSTQTNCFMGTLAYSSPEQMEGRELDARSDIYSLGVMMFQMLTGKMPLYADTHSFGAWYQTHCFQPPRSFESANSNVRMPKVLEALVMRCLAKSPDDRPESIAVVIRDLELIRRRYEAGWELRRRLEDKIEDIQVTRTPEEECRQQYWHSDKPIADIVFPHPLQTKTGQEALTTLWVMLPKGEIEKHRICTPYSRFFFLPSPHPVILWLTVLYSRTEGPRWLSCYLDLKNPLGQQMTRLLAQSGQYRVLFFPKQDHSRCEQVLTLTVKPAQCKELQEWATMSRMVPNLFQLKLAKNRLKEELEMLKPKILLTLESLSSEGQSSLPNKIF